MRPHSRLTSRQSKRFSQKKSNRLILTVTLVIFCIALWVYCFSRLTYLNAFTINNFAISGTHTSYNLQIENIARQTVDGSYWGLFSKANIFLYPHDEIASAINAAFPSIKSLSVNRNGLNELRVEVVEKVPSAIICPTLPDFSDITLTIINQNKCYLADSDGYIFSMDNLSSTTESIKSLNLYYMPAISELATSTSVIIGTYATTTKEYSALQEFYNGARKAGLVPSAILVKENGEYEMYVDGVIIFFNNSRSFAGELDNLVSFWNRVIVKGNDNPNNYESIDVRYGSNVFYRKIK